jgi:hypothetical protein
MRTRLTYVHSGCVGLLASFALAAIGCNSKSSASTQDDSGHCEVGAERCACYKNDTCDKGLTCLSSLCVSENGSGGKKTDAGGEAPGGEKADASKPTSPGGPSASHGGSMGSVAAPADAGLPSDAGLSTDAGVPASTGGSGSGQALEDGTVGASCGSCDATFSCVSDVPSGYCSKECSSDKECGEAGACIQTATVAACFRICESNADCRPKYACVSAGTVSVCDVATGTPEATTGGTCENSCAHYFECKAVYDAASYQSCLSSCSGSGYTSDYLAEYEGTDCATAIQLVEGSASSTGSGSGGADCNGCTWDGSSCVYLSQYTLVSTAGFACDQTCCPGH